jgi:hypothetical protein
VWLGYNDPAWLAVRHGVNDRAEVVRAIAGALDSLAEAVTRAP